MSGQAAYNTIAKQVKLPGIMDEFTESDDPRGRKGWTQGLKVGATCGVGSSQWGGMRPSPTDEERPARWLLCERVRAGDACSQERAEN
jgi:hypothetical protein